MINWPRDDSKKATTCFPFGYPKTSLAVLDYTRIAIAISYKEIAGLHHRNRRWLAKVGVS